LEKDRFKHYENFDIACSYTNGEFKYYLIKKSNVDAKLIKLNISCDVEPMCNGQMNEGIYSTLTKQIYIDNGYEATTDFWKHGKGGIIDIQEKIKPTHWYGE
jgi:hypothetical protein